jgi:tungstate transport system substrate-binding protein
MKEKSIFQILLLQLLFLLAFISLAKGSDKQDYQATYGKGDQAICVATGSPGALGLLQALAEPFCQANRCRINWMSDPAGISKAKSAQDAYERIAKAQATFFSRGDNSGTHKKEMKIWKLSGIEPAGNWYVVTKDFMGPTLMRADKDLGYFMTDSSTFFAKQSKIKNLKVLFKGDPILVNVYHALVASSQKHPQKNYALAAKFVTFVNSPAGQKIYREYGKIKYGAPLYNDAEYAKKWE